MIFLPAKGVERDFSFDGDTLVIPVVSTGNVGQLAVDLFLSSGRAESLTLVEKVGYLETELVAPVSGYEVFGPGQTPQLCVNLELHRFAESRVTVLQQRGGVLAGEERAFAAELVEWARGSGFKEILALTGADAAEGLDPTPFGRGRTKRFRAGTRVGAPALGPASLLPTPPCALEEALQGQGIGAFEAAGVVGGSAWSALAVTAPMGGAAFDAPGAGGGLAVGGVGLEEDEEEEEEEGSALSMEMEAFPVLPVLPSGTGVAGHLCAEASRAEEGTDPSPPLVILLHFCSEGDNTPEAIEMAQIVNALLKLLPGGDGSEASPEGAVRWTSPLSWASLYGTPPAADAYQ